MDLVEMLITLWEGKDGKDYRIIFSVIGSMCNWLIWRHGLRFLLSLIDVVAAIFQMNSLDFHFTWKKVDFFNHLMHDTVYFLPPFLAGYENWQLVLFWASLVDKRMNFLLQHSQLQMCRLGFCQMTMNSQLVFKRAPRLIIKWFLKGRGMLLGLT